MRTPGNWGATWSGGPPALQETVSDGSKFARRRCLAPDARRGAPAGVADGAAIGGMTQRVQAWIQGLRRPPWPHDVTATEGPITLGRRQPPAGAHGEIRTATSRERCGSGCQVAGHDTRMSAGVLAGERMSGRRPVAPACRAGRRSMWIRHSPHSETPRHPRRSACRGAVGDPQAPQRAWTGTLRTKHSPPGRGARLPAVVGVCAKSIRCSIGDG